MIKKFLKEFIIKLRKTTNFGSLWLKMYLNLDKLKKTLTMNIIITKNSYERWIRQIKILYITVLPY